MPTTASTGRLLPGPRPYRTSPILYTALQIRIALGNVSFSLGNRGRPGPGIHIHSYLPAAAEKLASLIM